MTKMNKTVLLDEEKLKKTQNDAKSEYWDNVRKNESNGYVKGTLYDKDPSKVKAVVDPKTGGLMKDRRKTDRRNKPKGMLTEKPTGMIIDHPAVVYIEKQYPETAREFKKIQKDQYLLFCQKQMDYGPSNIAMGTELKTDEEKRLSKVGLIVRINDKVQRLINLVVRNNRKSQNEPTIDAFKDLSCYGIIAQIVDNGKWGK